MDSTRSDEKSKKFWEQNKWKKFPNVDMMKLRKPIRNKERSSAKTFTEICNMWNNEWLISKEVIFEIEDKAFAEGGFRMAYKAKSDDSVSAEIHGLLRNIARYRRKPSKRWGKPVNHNHEKPFELLCLMFFSTAVLKVCEYLGECFNYNPVYFGKVCNSRGVFTWIFVEVH